MPQMSVPSFTRKQRGMKRESTRTSPARHSSSTSDPESKSRAHARRRIQLACVRCRRRKIRCSGETPDSAACTNCKAANILDCQFLRPDTTQLLPTPGSALAVHYQEISSRATSANAGSIGGKFHPYTGPSSLPLSTYDTSYFKSYSLSDLGLGNYGRVDLIQRESVSGNEFTNEYGIPYSMNSSAPSTMAEYYDFAGGRAWSSMPAAAMATDLDRSQSTIVYTTDVPSFFPSGNMLPSEDPSANRLLPAPTTTTSSSINTMSYFKDIDMVANGNPFMTGEETRNMYSLGSRSSKLTKNQSSSTTLPFSNTYGSVNITAHDQKSEVFNTDQNLMMMKYTAITNDAFGTLPLTSSAFTRSGTADSSDIEEPVMMSMYGPKNAKDDRHTKNDKSSACGHKLRAPLVEYVPRSDSGLYNHSGGSLQTSSKIRGLAWSHQNY